MAMVAVCSTKGGSGKTTLAFNLAERAWSSGLSVLLIDFDYQEASLGLCFNRLEQEMECWPVTAGSVTVAGAGELRSLRERGEYDLILCDLPGTQSMGLGPVLLEMDLVLSPVGVGPTDEMAAANILLLVKGMSDRVPLVFVPSHFPRGRRRLEGVVEALEDRGAVVCGVGVQDRVIHFETLSEGLGVCEKDPGSPAAEDVRRLWAWLCEQLELDVAVLEDSYGG